MILNTYKLKHGNEDNKVYFISGITPTDKLTGDIVVAEFGKPHFDSKKIAFRDMQAFRESMKYHEPMIVVFGEV
jgi:hypothetical protein